MTESARAYAWRGYADDLVDVARAALVGVPGSEPGSFVQPPAILTFPFERDDGTVVDLPVTDSSGRVPALDFAVMELLVEIRDLLRRLPEPPVYRFDAPLSVWLGEPKGGAE